MKTFHPIWIAVDFSAVTRNCFQIIQDMGTPLTAIVEGDAYRHGAAAVGYGEELRRVPMNQILIGGVSCSALGRLRLDQRMVRLPRVYIQG